MRVPDNILKCVMFIGVRRSGKSIHYAGTASIVTVPGLVNPEYNFGYLVTARHVAEDVDGKPFIVRANQKIDSTVKSVIIDGPQNVRWWYHPTEEAQVDAAVTVLSAHVVNAGLDISNSPISMFATDKIIADRHIGIGDEIVVVGLFNEVTNTSKNYPVVRTGNVAMMPGEQIVYERKNGKEKKGYANLVEGRSIGGLSGSPVFVRETVAHGVGDLMCGVGKFYFFGVMRGHWDLPQKSYPQLAEAVNMGISIVTPATKVLEILNQHELAKMRSDEEELIKHTGKITLDSKK